MPDHAEPKTRSAKIPGPDHSITIERNPHRVVVTAAGRVVADTRDALTLREASYPAVQYVSCKDVDMALLEQTDHATYLPLQGGRRLLQHPRGRRALDRCGVDLRDALYGRRRHQGSSCFLP